MPKSKEPKGEVQTSLRLGDDVLSRIDALIPALSADPVYAAFSVSRATVLRIALMRGLESLETSNAQRFRIAQLTRPDGARGEETLGDDYEGAVFTMLRRWEAELVSSPNPLKRRVIEDVIETYIALGPEEGMRLAAAYNRIHVLRGPSELERESDARGAAAKESP